MSGNRLFTKALRRLVPKLKELEESVAALVLDADFDDMVVSFVDASPGYHAEEIESRDRVYHVDVPIPQQQSFRPTDDDKLLVEMLAELREAFESAPVRESTRAELMQRFSKWESTARQQSMRAV